MTDLLSSHSLCLYHHARTESLALIKNQEHLGRIKRSVVFFRCLISQKRNFFQSEPTVLVNLANF